MAGEHPEIIEKLTNYYEECWDEFMELDEKYPFTPIIIGSDKHISIGNRMLQNVDSRSRNHFEK